MNSGNRSIIGHVGCFRPFNGEKSFFGTAIIWPTHSSDKINLEGINLTIVTEDTVIDVYPDAFTDDQVTDRLVPKTLKKLNGDRLT